MTMPPTGPDDRTLALTHQLLLNAFSARNKEALAFVILNDTTQLISYNRAILWDIEDRFPQLLGVSGRTSVNKASEMARRWKRLVKALKEPHKPQVLSDKSFKQEVDTWHAVQAEQGGTSVLWLPIACDDRTVGGLWLERWNGEPWLEAQLNPLPALLKGYGVAWQKIIRQGSLRRLLRGKAPFIAVIILCLLFLVRVPLRVVAPCEVIAKDPYLITAPLDGIIANVDVTPGQSVKKGDLLFAYDKRVPMEQLQVAQKEVEILQSEVNRTMTQGVKDDKSLAEMAIMTLRMQREKIELELAQYHASLLDVKAPIDGVVLLDDPETWRGKPVKVGEKIMIISDPHNTKVRIWVPVNDNVVLNDKKPIRVFLNINPERSYEATLIYIASYSTITEKQVAAFQADANWSTPQPNMRLGLKGTAILYGDSVPLAYYLFRKPWAYLRQLFGV